ncbi:hypothetical protein CQ14_25945 [Bradyrhizobium lablabi]|uniref:Uncharacterized protein n=2 Tax=Nitrobacteraceae TaxID=41294 RepID=A0A0R3MHS4_9BRAD|nr:hypothetical protein CQ14_25945 [Bradyrhizobium lablabi]
MISFSVETYYLTLEKETSMTQQPTYGQGQEAEALKEAIREVAEAQKATQLAVVNEKLTRIAQLLAAVQV